MRVYFMETLRLGFSHWSQEDLPLAQSLWGNEEVSRFITRSGHFSEKEIQARLDREIENDRQYSVQYWMLFDKEHVAFLGCCGLRPFQPDNAIFEIGVHLLPQYWGKGIATEASLATMQYAREHLQARELFAGHHPLNTNSGKVLHRLGFAYIGDEYYGPTGLYHPSYRYILGAD
ncbi:MAG: GNAT family N-acetyltransferase [Symbiobacteriaceae bacterium]|nr:GNAT family N-acetyltransferase [Symbiobacteriaceae bacterium]